MLIIEGSDCLGKTTAAKRLVELAREEGMDTVCYNHMGRPDNDFNFHSDYLPMMLPNVVADRFHLGGIVWHDHEIAPSDLRWIEGHLYTQGSVIVVMYSSDPEAYKYKMEREGDRKDLFNIDVRLKANQYYGDMVHHTGLRKDEQLYFPLIDFRWDVGFMGYPQDKDLLEWLGKWKARLSSYERFIKESTG